MGCAAYKPKSKTISTRDKKETKSSLRMSIAFMKVKHKAHQLKTIFEVGPGLEESNKDL